MVLSGNTLYGTAPNGGSSGSGTVFALHIDGTGFTNLYSFTNGTDGANPAGALVLSGNTLFGTAPNGGGSGAGTVFALYTDGTGFTNLHSFSGRTDGANPASPLVLSGNTLFGTAPNGGSSGAGTVFALHTDGTGFDSLYSFTAPVKPNGGYYGLNSDGANPAGALVLSGNTLYGTAPNGGSLGSGTVFSLALAMEPLLSVNGGMGNGLEGIGPGIEDGEYIASCWTFTAAFNNVSYTVAANGLYRGAGTTENYYLTDAIGPSATSSNVIWSGSETFASGGWADGTTPVFTGLNLGPGTYYLIIAPSAEITWQPATGNGRGEIVAATNNVTFVGTLTPAYNGANGLFPPASTWWGQGAYGAVQPGFDLAFTLTEESLPAVVVNNLIIKPAVSTIGTGWNESFAATGYFSDGSVSSLAPTNGLVWSSSNPAVASINTNGVATGLTTGTTTITATVGSVSVNATLTVHAPTNLFLFAGSEINITLPPGAYTITAYGAQGGIGGNSTSGGLGGEVEAQFNFPTSTTLTLLVGGTGGNGYSGGGGGGSFVVNGSTPLVIAGGGGGGSYEGYDGNGANGSITTNGGIGANGVSGGTAGGGGGGVFFGGGGGGGYLGNGGAGSSGGAGGSSFISGGAGGGGNGTGGYGGGGGGFYAGGGGGGYSGGGGGNSSNDGYGGGGGSIIDSSAITNLAEVSGIASPDDSPNGEIIIIGFSAPSPTNIVVTPTNPVIVAGSNENFAATGYYSNGSSNVLASTNGLVWSSSNPNVATINSNGVVTGLTSGTTTITATDGSVSNNTTLTVVTYPVIQTNPVSATVAEGATVVFSVSATGGSLDYQWQYNTTNLPGANASVLVLTNVSFANTGYYTVTASNIAGSAISSSAKLQVLPAVFLTSGLSLKNGEFQFNFVTVAGFTYTVQYSTNMTDWISLLILDGFNEPLTIIDPNATDTGQRFYRIKVGQ